MSASLPHSPADVLRSLLVGLGVVSQPPSDDWPAHLVLEPDRPDAAVTLTDTSARVQARDMITREYVEYPGVQVNVRASNHRDCWEKADEITKAMDAIEPDTDVTVESNTYRVHSVHRVSSLRVDGKQTLRTSRNQIFLNVLVDVRLRP